MNLLLLADPDVPDGPDLRILEGNLQLRMSNFYLASDTFSKVRDEFEPIHRQLNQVIVRSQTDPAYFDTLVGKSLDKFDIGAFVPPAAAKWVKAEPEVARMMVLATDVGDMQRDLAESQKLLERIQHVMDGRGRVGIFPDLAAQRTKSIEMMNQLVDTRQKFAGKIRAIIDPVLTPEERKELDRIAIERDGLERQLSGLPTTDEGVLAHERTMKERFAEIDRQASELNVEIQALEAQLVAIEKYYRVSRSEQKIRPEDIRQPVRDMRTTIEELRGMHDKLREAIADARRDATAAGGIGEAERETTQEADRAAAARAGDREAGDGAARPATIACRSNAWSACWARCDAIETQLYAFDKRIDAQVTKRLDDREPVPGGREGGAGPRLGQAGRHHGGVEEHGRRPRPGDVHQGRRQVLRPGRPLRRRHHRRLLGPQGPEDQAVTRLTNQKNLELKALDEDFRKVLEEDK